ncbi:probable 2-oxoglutarate-dependent dioxygenase AOP1 [Vicia villosa]|uniref:probable 2-oxoglutarate-dependent dioxygenase AOP1 n=1 Tax=Vicia villosa TaxID=3911 RepID=UPI00273BF4A7|nr:probable 2-oxoglutarate-dependent dioxygenase AOP1 [Vicia villosa]
MDSESGIPILDFRKSTRIILEEGSQGWKEMSKKVIETFESHGVFLLRCDEIPNKLQKEMFTCMKSLFELPEETKLKFSDSRLARGSKISFIPHSQSFGIEDAFKLETTQNFTNRMWPEGNPTFCETLFSFVSKARELNSLILKMIVEGFDLLEKYNLEIEKLSSDTNSRLTMYQFSVENKDSAVTFVPHTDKSTITLICENEIQGLQVLQKSGNWVNVNVPSNGFVVIVGDILQTWSNGRFEAPMHRVVLKGDNKERFVFVLFSFPKKDTLIKIPSELVDEEDHPLRYKSFKYEEFINFINTTGTKEGALEEFAGL